MRRPALSRTPESPRRVRVREALGQGGQSTVFRAEFQDGAGPPVVAVKTLNRALCADPRLQQRILREAKLLAGLQHRAIVGVHELVQSEDRWLLVLEHVPGADLQRLLRAQGPAPVAAALALLAELASALDACWQQPGPDGAPMRLVHGDLKPSNTMLTAAGEVKLLDFGLAGIGEGEPGGSPAYRPPHPAPRAAHADDVFALGAIFVELVLGTPLGPLDDDDALATRLAELLPRVEALAGHVAEPLGALLLGVLACDAGARPDAHTVERVCRDLLPFAPGPGLLAWASDVVPPLLTERVDTPFDPLVGATLTLDPRG